MIGRRTALTMLAAGAVAPAAIGHTLYPQWVAYRRKHLLIGCHRRDARTYTLAKALVAELDHALPKAKARPARAPHPERLASLIGTDQMELAVLSIAEAQAMAEGRDRFAPYGKIALTKLAEMGNHLLVAEAGFPARHGWMVTSALRDTPLRVEANKEVTLPLHSGAQAFLNGIPLEILATD